MKKLMIAAAAAAMVTGAFAQHTPGSAYQVRFNLRTLAPADVTCDESKGCKLCGGAWEENITYYRPTTRNLKAILSRCIECGESITNLNNYVFAMWEEAYNFRYTTSAIKGVIDKSVKDFQDNAQFQLNKHGYMNVRQFGSQGQYVAIEGWLGMGWSALDPVDGLNLTFAGFGEGRTSDGRIGQVSGSVVGEMLPLAQGHYFNQTNAVCFAFDDLCEYQGLLSDVDPIAATRVTVPAYGYWTMRSVDGAKDMSFKELTGNGAAILTK